jgi:hypothetical protein
MRRTVIGLMGLLTCVLVGGVIAEESARAKAPPPIDVASNGIQRATAAGKYALVLFHQKGEGVAAMREGIKKAVDNSKGRAESVEVDAGDAACLPTVRQYGMNRAPLPLVLVIAPNGAVTGGFPGTCDDKVLADAMVGKVVAGCLKSLQDGNLVFVSVPGTNAAGNEAAMQGVKAMAADERFAGYTATFRVQAEDGDSGELLAKLKVVDAGQAAVTVLLAPPGRVVGTYTGATDKAVMVADLIRAMAGSTCGSGGGCGTGGCGPK